MAIGPAGAWFPNIPDPGVLANQSDSKSGGLRSAFGEGGLVFPSLLGVSTLNYWLVEYPFASRIWLLVLLVRLKSSFRGFEAFQLAT